MKIVSREQFLELPENTLYCKYEVHWFGDICVKVSEAGQYPNDFLEENLNHFIESETKSQIEIELKVGDEFRYDKDQISRDGMFDGDEVMFAIFDNEDIDQLIQTISKCKK